MGKERPSHETLHRLYINERLSTRAIGRLLNIEAGTVRRWLMDAGVSIRSIADAKAGQKPAAHTVEASVASRRKNRIKGMPTVGYKLRADGYVDIYLPTHPSASKTGYIRQHRLVMETFLGRLLRPDEIVHHRNGKKTDNRVENLEITNRSDHAAEHIKERRLDPKTGRLLSHSRTDSKARS